MPPLRTYKPRLIMNIQISFLGAAQNVTGSRYLIEANGKRILVDCGLHQERPFRERDWLDFPVPPKTIDAILLTHAHLDHSGLLPKLVKDGSICRIYCTPETAELCAIVLADSAELQMEDVEFKKKRHKQEGRQGSHPEVPLYDLDDVRKCTTFFSPKPYERTFDIGEGIEATFYDAGHILGSSMVMIKIRQNNEERSIVFTGDMGRKGSPILRDPSFFKDIDYIVMESTYGDRTHEDRQESIDVLAETINDTVKSGGNIVMPAFVVERSQDILYYLNKLLDSGRIPHLAVFLDSPMAVRVTEVFERHSELFDEEAVQTLLGDHSFFNFSRLHLVSSIAESKSINYIKGTIIIMAGSGMCTGGRIKHHLAANISRKESTILFTGYQAEATLGRLIVSGEQEVRILGKMYQVKAKIVQIDGFSSHADKNDLLNWLSALQKPPRHIFVTHGEVEAASKFADAVKASKGWQVSVPAYLDKVTLD
jgi:metallo-beta-lactamase family protein